MKTTNKNEKKKKTVLREESEQNIALNIEIITDKNECMSRSVVKKKKKKFSNYLAYTRCVLPIE